MSFVNGKIAPRAFLLQVSTVSYIMKSAVMNDRIRLIRKALKLTQGELAKHLGMQSSALSMIEKGENALTEKNIKLICMTFNVSEDWLRTGGGEMFAASPYEKEFFEIYGGLLPETQDTLLRLAKDLLATQRKLSAPTVQAPGSEP